MLRKALLIISLLFYATNFAQSNQLIVNKIASEICSCIQEKKELQNKKTAYEQCYKLKLATLSEFLSKDEIAYYKNNHEKAINRGLFLAVNQNCSALNPDINSINETNAQSFPINISENNFNKLLDFENKFVALEGVVIAVEKHNNRIFSKIALGKHTIWIESMVESGFEKVNNNLKFLGKISKNSPFFKKNESAYHLIAYGIVNTKTNNFMYYPGFETSMSVWRNGKIPTLKQ